MVVVCIIDDYVGYEKVFIKKDIFEGGNFSKIILIINCVYGYKKIKR